MLRFSEQDHQRVSDAVAQAEARSDGEIVTILAEKSDSYHDVALHYAVLAMLLVPVLLAALPQSAIDWLSASLIGWNAELSRIGVMTFLFAALVLAFLTVRLLTAWMPLRMALTPPGTKNRRVRRRALQTFRIGAEKRTHGRTGVLLYLSLLERRAEIVADEAIASQVEADVWGAAMEVLISHVKDGNPGEGLALAVEEIGAVLARCLPRTAGDTNELPDRLIEI